MSSYSKNLQYYLKELTAYTRRNHKLLGNISQTQSLPPQSKIIVRMPENSLIDWDTFTFWYEFTAPNYNVASKNSESIIGNCQVEINGKFVDVSAPRSYNLVQRRLIDLNGGDKLVQRAKLQNSLVDLSKTATSSADVNRVACVNSFLGYVGTSQPRIQDTSILGSVNVHITLAGDEILAQGSSGTGGDYSISNVYFTMDTVNIDDDNYYKVLSQKMQEAGKIVIPFQTLSSFSSGVVSSLTQTTQGVIATESLDMLLGFYQSSGSLGRTPNYQTGASSYFTTGSANITGDRFWLNGKPLLDYLFSPAETYNRTLNAFGHNQDAVGSPDVYGSFSNNNIGLWTGTNAVISMQDWQDNQFFSVLRLNHPSSPDDRLKSGVNLIGTNSVIGWETQGSEANITPTLVALVTKELEVFPFKQLNVVE